MTELSLDKQADKLAGRISRNGLPVSAVQLAGFAVRTGIVAAARMTDALSLTRMLMVG